MDKLKYQISSRATILLGRENVSDVQSALIELIKNTYDADADFAYVCFDTEDNTIYIFDNGIGMTKEIIINNWMLIGTDNKKIEYKTKKNRIKSGEKGIGRFALDRIGGLCEMYTKHAQSDSSIYWKTAWSDFEQQGKKINEIEADCDILENAFENYIPSFILDDIKKISENDEFEFDFATGTLLKIGLLRDQWDDKLIKKIEDSLIALIPPIEQDDYIILLKKSKSTDTEIIMGQAADDYDYKIDAEFDGDSIHISLSRNEFNLNAIPESIFTRDEFKEDGYRKKDFQKKILNYNYSINELMNTDDLDLIEHIKQIGMFKFNYIFMKLSVGKKYKEKYFYKEISPVSVSWMNKHSGIKIYRDNFTVLPYGHRGTKGYDWLDLDARKSASPAAVSDKSGGWKVRNNQGQGTLFISRVYNNKLVDQSNRQGIIENYYFELLIEMLRNIISRFEKDRAHIVKGFRAYDDEINQKSIIKKEGKDLAKNLLDKKDKGQEKVDENLTILAETIKVYQDEAVELISENKLLRALATNGLITTAIAHDLKNLSANFANRSEYLTDAIEANDVDSTKKLIADINNDDRYFASWLDVVTSRVKEDKRARKKVDIIDALNEIVNTSKNLLEKKGINIVIKSTNEKIYKKMFSSDLESIIYNLIINSIQSFEKSKSKDREIKIEVEINSSDIIFHYSDTGDGLNKKFKDPYEIFLYGTTSKRDKNNEISGTGLGMYIVSLTISEYNGTYKLIETENRFKLDFSIPL